MTLQTTIVVRTGMAARPVFDKGRELLGCTDAHKWKRLETYGPGWGNLLGQGLPGLLDVVHGPDGPLLRDCYCDEKCPNPNDCQRDDEPRGFIRVGLDTGYSYRAVNGAGCADLHAWFVRELGRWLDSRGAAWSWQNEFTGEWFDGYGGLDEFGDADLGALPESVLA